MLLVPKKLVTHMLEFAIRFLFLAVGYVHTQIEEVRQ